MRKRIYLHLLLVGVVCILVTAFLCAFTFWQTTKQRTLQNLMVSLAVLSREAEGSPHPEKIWDAAGKAPSDLRITWVAPDGSVRYDSWENPQTMENHKSRPEIALALKNGEGSYARQSATLGEMTLYAAKKLPDGSVLRAARTQKNLFRPLADRLPWWLLSLVLLVAVCQWTVGRLTKGILEPLDEAARYLSRVGSGTPPEKTDAANFYPELRPFLSAIARQGEQLDRSFQQLQQERNTMKSITDNLQEGVLLLDDKLRIQWINTWGFALLEEPRTLLDSRSRLLGQFLLPLLPAASRPDADTLKNTRQRHWSMEKNGRQYELYLRPLTPPQQRATRLLLILDVTESRQREKLRQDFTANVTHELKTPLTSVSGFAELMAAGLVEKKEDIAHFGGLIRQEAKRLLAMINSLLLLSKIEEVPESSLKETVQLEKITAATAEFLQPFCQEKKVTLHTRLMPAAVLGSSSLLRELVMNLLDNGIKYNKPGGHLYVTVEAKEHKAVLTVKDTGIGIPDSARQRIFERFYRVEKSRSKQSGGTGLGLAIVKHITELHGGEIHLASREGKGSTFTVILPLAE